MSELVQIQHLRNYSKCPNFAKYSWHLPTKTQNKNVIQSVIESCYRDLALLNKIVDWKTIRNRVHAKLVELEPDLNNNEFYTAAVTILSSLRNWYLEIFRKENIEAVTNIKVSTSIFDTKLESVINGILIENGKITLIDFSEKENVEEILKDIEIKLKVYLLSKENIKVDKILSFSVTERSVKIIPISINNIESWNYNTEQVLKVMLYSIKNKIFYPSPTLMCTTCKYKDICSW